MPTDASPRITNKQLQDSIVSIQKGMDENKIDHVVILGRLDTIESQALTRLELIMKHERSLYGTDENPGIRSIMREATITLKRINRIVTGVTVGVILIIVEIVASHFITP
jgi:hypothetical protein